MPFKLAGVALVRALPEILQAVSAAPADLIYAGTVGGLTIAPLAASRFGVPFGVDLEDLYAEDCPDTPDGKLETSLISRQEKAVLGSATFLTAGSESIAAAYRARYGVKPITINNVVPKPSSPPAPTRQRPEGRRLFWFSQTIGPGRGLEDVVFALGRLDLPAELNLLGNATHQEYLQHLERGALRSAPKLRIVCHPPIHPDQLLQHARQYDIGLSLERMSPPSRAHCLTNKALTCIAAGLAVVLTDTPGHRALVSDLGDGAIVFPPGDLDYLAKRLHPWLANDLALNHARATAFEAACRRWHWEHADERGALLAAVDRALRRS